MSCRHRSLDGPITLNESVQIHSIKRKDASTDMMDWKLAHHHTYTVAPSKDDILSKIGLRQCLVQDAAVVIS